MEGRDGRLPNPEQLGRALRVLRVEREMTLEALAKASDLHWTYLSGIERGRRNPTLKVLAAVAGALQITTSELIRLAEEVDNRES
ncbi:MAG TPA: helix-turn-helix transcriptional regulator [Solirubrobacterales bacterium]|jgi:transcriptional regulator with XRE-family HTH domain|nr:helix-turn-helix transcriptional regulator [Solirubrobacterales bacterium]